MSDVRLIVNGRRYGGWKGVRITRSIESVAGSFSLDISDRWAGQGEPWPIAEEDECRVEIDGEPVIDGFVDTRTLSLTGNDRAMSVGGRDRSAALVDNSAVLSKWAFRDQDALAVARVLCAPFGIEASLQDGIVLPKPPRKTTVTPGESAWAVIERVAKHAGLLVVSDGAGGVLLTRTGSSRAAPLVEGQNLLGASVEYNASERYARYVAFSQNPGTDQAAAAVTRVRAEASDEGVRRSDRVLLIRTEYGVPAGYARQRADWDARIRAARAETVSVTVRGWKQPDGELWPVNAKVSIRAPAIGVSGVMLIASAEYMLTEGGETTSMRLVRPDAFTPEPRTAKVKSGGAGTRWKEIAGGAR